jgi:transposase
MVYGKANAGPVVPQEVIDGLPAGLKPVLELLVEQLRQVRQENEALRKENEELRRRLGLDSSNSSKPPSTDGPAERRERRKKGKRGPTGKKPGGQPGHTGSRRAMLDASDIDERIDCVPSVCRRCHAPLRGMSCARARRASVWQQVDVRAGKRLAVEYRMYRLRCGCGARTRGSLPAGVQRSAFGPGAKAVMVRLTSVGLSRYVVQSLMDEVLGIAVSVGALDAICKEAARALEVPCDEVQDRLREQASVHMDETTWWVTGKLHYLWVMISTLGAVFKIAPTRARDNAAEMLGNFRGILVSDRYVVYRLLDAGQRQVCWAHLARDFEGLASRSGYAKKVGEWALRERNALFAAWHTFLDDPEITRDELRAEVLPIRARLGRLLKIGARRLTGSARGMCRQLLKDWEALFTFIDVEGVEPTNNLAERAVRPAVLWRRRSFGTRSSTGSVFVARILTASMTLKLHSKRALDYLSELFTAIAHGAVSPSLLGP